VIAAYDSLRKIGGLAHAMFLAGGWDKNMDIPLILDASKAIDEMIEDMTLLGANRDDIEVCLVTGENVNHEQGDPTYRQKITTTINLLKEKHIRCREDTATDVGHYHISFDVESGRISYV
jgi:chemotaxis receptor (MCP) glutamine deamidase CheD